MANKDYYQGCAEYSNSSIAKMAT